MHRLPLIPPSLFSIALGIAGLADARDAARSVLRIPAALTAGRVVVLVSLAATVLVGGWLTGQWIAGDRDQDRALPGGRAAALDPAVRGRSSLSRAASSCPHTMRRKPHDRAF